MSIKRKDAIEVALKLYNILRVQAFDNKDIRVISSRLYKIGKGEIKIKRALSMKNDRIKENENNPKWLKETIKKENLNEQLRDIIRRYRSNPDYSKGEYDLDTIIRFMQPFLMGLADQAREYYEEKFNMLERKVKNIKNNLSEIEYVEDVITRRECASVRNEALDNILEFIEKVKK